MAIRVGHLVLAAIALSGAHVVLAQTSAPPIPELSGTWTLNFEASSASSDVVKTAPTPPPPDPPGRPVGPGGATDGASSPRGPQFNDPTKTGSLLPPNLGTPSDAAGGAQGQGPEAHDRGEAPARAHDAALDAGRHGDDRTRSP